MGIAANQARLMTLTARQNDLELRAQQISATKMTISLESQQYATAYSAALNAYGLVKQAENVYEQNKKYTIDAQGNVKEDDTKGKTYTLSALLQEVAKKAGYTGTAITSSTELLNLAKANYDTETARISSQEKLYDMELTQINTEHSAVKTEYDAVKSLIGDNVDKSFNVFG